MIVSNFELLFRRVAPFDTNLISFQPVNQNERFVAQGYFLTITNLENRIIHLRLRLVIPASNLDASNPLVFDREILTSPPFFRANIKTLLDNADSDDLPIELTSVTPKQPNTREFVTDSFSIFANQTISVAILPPASNIMNVRGFTVLEQVLEGAGQTLIGVRAAAVLTTPDQRSTTVEVTEGGTRIPAIADFDQTAYTLPTASGKAQNIVEAVRGLIRDPSDTVGLDETEIIGLEKVLAEVLKNNKSVGVE